MIEELVNYLSLDLKLVLMGIGIAIGVTQVLKKFGHIKGWACLVPTGLCSIMQGFLYGLPDATAILGYMFAIFIGSIMGWEVYKGTRPKPTTK